MSNSNNSNSNNKDGKRQIKIYQRTYSLPVLGGGKLDKLQTEIRSGSQNLQRGYVERETKVEEKGFFSKKVIRKVVRQELNFEQRFAELDKLVKNYDAVIETLQTHQGEYQDFFENLADEIRAIVTCKCQDIANVEQERLEVERIAQQENDVDLLQIAASQKAQILETAKAIGYAAILMLKKLDLMSASLEKIANDQQTQREVLESMVKKLSVQKKAYQVQLKINRLQAEAAELTKIALNFESYMESFLGSFQTLLGNVAKVDKDLSGAMQEIKQIAEMAMSQQAGDIVMNDRSSQKILDFLVASDMKKDRLLDALESSRNANNEVEFDYRLKSANANTSLDVCLENIQTYVQFELKPVLAVKEERQKKELAAAELHRQTEAQLAKQKNRVLLSQLNLELVDIRAGSFLMGSNDYDNEKPIHKVTLKAFKIGKYPITQKQYMAVMGNNPSNFKGDNLPVEKVSWDDAVAFCKKLSQMIGQTVKLPSEAQWEYACRAGSTGKYCFGDNVNQLGNYAWYNENSESKTHPVGAKLANSWELHDMHGNVWEWCEDVWHENYNNAPTDCYAWLNSGEQTKRALRCGSWYYNDSNCRSAFRGWDLTVIRYDYIGFRVVV
jgi:formylglycine-generating enzyme required for sulfatase activity